MRKKGKRSPFIVYILIAKYYSDQLLKCIFAHILVNVPMFVNILNAAKVLVIAAHLLVIVESIQADVHINVDMMVATRALHVKQY